MIKRMRSCRFTLASKIFQREAKSHSARPGTGAAMFGEVACGTHDATRGTQDKISVLDAVDGSVAATAQHWHEEIALDGAPRFGGPPQSPKLAWCYLDLLCLSF
jgi:hypothetical protein